MKKEKIDPQVLQQQLNEAREMGKERIEEIEQMDIPGLQEELKTVGEKMRMEKIWMFGSESGSQSELDHLLNNERFRKEYRYISDLLKSKIV